MGRGMGRKENTIGVEFSSTKTSLKEHASSRVHSIMYSSEMEMSKKSLLFMRCQDYMKMIQNSDNCLNELSNKVRVAVNADHLNADLFNNTGNMGGMQRSNDRGLNVSFMGNTGKDGGSFFGRRNNDTGSFFRGGSGYGSNTSGNSFLTQRSGQFISY
jgi:hypothetical protein